MPKYIKCNLCGDGTANVCRCAEASESALSELLGCGKRLTTIYGSFKMGMYDSVWVDCPECGRRTDFQSKAGLCQLIDYNMASVPPEVAESIIGDTEICQCGRTLKLKLARPIKNVELLFDDETD